MKSLLINIELKKYTAIMFMLFVVFNNSLKGQNVSVSDDSTYSAHSSAMLDVKSTTKGLLIPRVALSSTGSAQPITSPQTSLLVYNTATTGDVVPGYYYWDSSKWIKITNKGDLVKPTIKTSNTTLEKTEILVLASNDITITLPAITNSDNGLSISIKNIGTPSDLIVVNPSGSSLIDGLSYTTLTRWQGQTFIAYNGNWLVPDKTPRLCNLLDVSSRSSWVSIEEVLEFLSEHMIKPVTVRLSEETYEIQSTITIDLPYPVTFEGLSFGSSSLVAASGLEGKPMFRCLSECYFKMLMFDGTALTGYGTSIGEDAVRLVGNGTYHEIKDCTFENFYNAVVDSSDAELWLFECDITGSAGSGVLLHSNTSGAKFRVSETDFISCSKGINLEKGSNAIVQISSGAYLNSSPTDIGICYDPANFINFQTMIITNNSWNNIGSFISGFDFSRTDGRDSKAFIISNAGIPDQIPSCKINVRNNNNQTNIINNGTWYKALWTTTSTMANSFKVEDNKITYLSSNSRNIHITITGDLSVNNSNRTISIGIVKNGVTTTRYGECDLRVTNANQPFQFATVVCIDNIVSGDYFELYCTSSQSGDNVKFQDIQWYTETK